MDPRIWSRLPNRLVARVICFLPPPALFRFRSVSNRWNHLISSKCFVEDYYLRIAPRHHWFLFFKSKRPSNYIYRSNNGCHDNQVCEGYLYDPYEKKWYRLTFPLVSPGFSPAASSGGLIAWVSDDPGHKTILVSNPVSKSFTTQLLPPTSEPRLLPAVGLFANNRTIYVMVAGDDQTSQYAVKNITTERYHFDGAGIHLTWDINSKLPDKCNFETGRMVFMDGKFYCMNYKPFTVYVFDVLTNQWSQMEPPMRRHILSPCLVECKGRLYLVAKVAKNKLKVPKSLRVWRLSTDGSKWDNFVCLQQLDYDQFIAVENGKGFDCVGSGDFIAITVKGSDITLLYDLFQKTWDWIPPCPFLYNAASTSNGCGGGRGLHGFAYEPQPFTPVMDLFNHQLQSFLAHSIMANYQY
uniref:UNUSUAL FLORAL ORGANS n=1 Tax=Thalictrum thalictroides TaxID=46969 RepID=A0A7S8MU64_THATH|nr:UNUSUAL FLORAL ORGANS [Thalictrum thalictroides]